MEHGGRSAQARAMTLLCAVSTTAALLSARFPMTDRAPVRLVLLGGALAAVLAALAWWVRHPAVLHAGLVAHALGLGVLIAASHTGVGAAGLTVGYVWLGLYAACFLSRRAARAHVALLAATLAAGLAADPFLGAAQVGLLVGGTLVLATEVVGRLVGRLADAARRDPLTGLLNRAGLQEEARDLLRDASRTGRPLSLAVADLDGFKLVNDVHGHAAGDALLVALADDWRARGRRADVLARLGGDEFVLLLPDTGPLEAAALLDRLREGAPAGFSTGVATTEPGDGLDGLLRRADGDLYRNKARRPAREQARTLHLS